MPEVIWLDLTTGPSFKAPGQLCGTGRSPGI
jgi:hypothetical protein